MQQLLAHVVPEEEFQMFMSFAPTDPLVVAFWWATYLLGFFFLVHLVLHVTMCFWPTASLKGMVAPKVILKTAVLYFVASVVVMIYSGRVSSIDLIAAGGTPDPVIITAAISECLRHLLFGMIGLFLGLFDYFAFAAKFTQRQASLS